MAAEQPWPPQEGDVWQFSHTSFGTWFRLDERMPNLGITSDRRMAWMATVVRENTMGAGEEQLGDQVRILFYEDATRSHSMWKFIDEG